jgi:hypothetical protein
MVARYVCEKNRTECSQTNNFFCQKYYINFTRGKKPEIGLRLYILFKKFPQKTIAQLENLKAKVFCLKA